MRTLFALLAAFFTILGIIAWLGYAETTVAVVCGLFTIVCLLVAGNIRDGES